PARVPAQVGYTTRADSPQPTRAFDRDGKDCKRLAAHKRCFPAPSATKPDGCEWHAAIRKSCAAYGSCNNGCRTTPRYDACARRALRSCLCDIANRQHPKPFSVLTGRCAPTFWHRFFLGNRG